MNQENTFQPEIKSSELNTSFEDIIDSSLVSEEIKKSAKQSNVIIMPKEGFRDLKEPLFPAHTKDLFDFLNSNYNESFKPEILIDEKDFHEFDLHFDITPLGGFLIENIALPIFLSFLYDYLKQYFAGIEHNKQNIEIELSLYENGKNKIKKLRYKGPSDKLEESINKVLNSNNAN